MKYARANRYAPNDIKFHSIVRKNLLDPAASKEIIKGTKYLVNKFNET